MRRMFRGLGSLTVANIKSYYRDRATLFWTLAFPVVFVVLFGSIFSGAGPTRFAIGWVDQDQTEASSRLREGFAQVELLELHDHDEPTALQTMRDGQLDSVIVVPSGLGTALTPGAGGGQPFELVVYTDPSQQTASQTIQQVVAQVVGGINQAITGQPPALAVTTQTIQAQSFTNAAYFVPSILAMALMQLGVFAAIPLTAAREKLILKRLGATPLSRATLVGSNVLTRLLVALVQTVIIVGIGAVLFGVGVNEPLAMVGLVALGAVTFLSIGYVIASYARTEDAANTLASVVQFPLMFLSGIFFPIDFMPEWLQPVAALMPLTYLADALRQTMIGGVPYAPLGIDVLVLVVWLVVTFVISARFFRWQ